MSLDAAAALCRQFEGFRPAPYLCPAGVPTIGYGSTSYADGRRVTLADAPITREDADALLLHELHHVFAPAVARLVPGLQDHPGPWNATVDWAYNLGPGRLQTSTLRHRLIARDWPGAAEQLRRWTRGGGRILPGLVRRREAEVSLLPVG